MLTLAYQGEKSLIFYAIVYKQGRNYSTPLNLCLVLANGRQFYSLLLKKIHSGGKGLSYEIKIYFKLAKVAWKRILTLLWLDREFLDIYWRLHLYILCGVLRNSTFYILNPFGKMQRKIKQRHPEKHTKHKKHLHFTLANLLHMHCYTHKKWPYKSYLVIYLAPMEWTSEPLDKCIWPVFSHFYIRRVW